MWYNLLYRSCTLGVHPLQRGFMPAEMYADGCAAAAQWTCPFEAWNVAVPSAVVVASREILPAPSLLVEVLAGQVVQAVVAQHMVHWLFKAVEDGEQRVQNLLGSVLQQRVGSVV
jgi:hypothetical protein